MNAATLILYALTLIAGWLIRHYMPLPPASPPVNPPVIPPVLPPVVPPVVPVVPPVITPVNPPVVPVVPPVLPPVVYPTLNDIETALLKDPIVQKILAGLQTKVDSELQAVLQTIVDRILSQAIPAATALSANNRVEKTVVAAAETAKWVPKN